jgi:transposase
MRGEDEQSGSLFSYVDFEARIDQNHPLRMIRMIVNEALAALAGDFSALYSRMGRPSIAPEKLLRATLLQAFYSIRSERREHRYAQPNHDFFVANNVSRVARVRTVGLLACY